MDETVTPRTRVAPSPTGAPHIGTAYMALFNCAFARHGRGQFILRIEDTDRARSTPEAEAAILEALRWIGLSWDEGPDVGGPAGPYRQSERTALYRDHAWRLVDRGAAYPCFCPPERLTELRRSQEAAKAPVGYDGRCATLAPSEARRRADSGETHVLRLRVPAEGDCCFQDRLRGEIRIPWIQVDHQVLLKSDGFPTYHLAVVVDDHLMGITHVMRGEEWINSTPKHCLLFEAFGWARPQFVHLPLLRNPDKTKLSKRRNPTSILYYRDAGFLPEALLNYLGLMAYSMPDGREVFSFDDLVASFDLNRISLGGPVFDFTKLVHFNGRYIRALNPEDLWKRLSSWAVNADTWRRIVPLAQPRLNQLSDFVPMAAFLFADRIEYPIERLIQADLDAPRIAALLHVAIWELSRVTPWTAGAVKAAFERMAAQEEIKLKTMLMPFFVAVSGSTVALPLYESLELLGFHRTIRRLQYALEALARAGGALSGKALKQLELNYRQKYLAGLSGPEGTVP